MLDNYPPGVTHKDFDSTVSVDPNTVKDLVITLVDAHNELLSMEEVIGASFPNGSDIFDAVLAVTKSVRDLELVTNKGYNSLLELLDR